MDDFERDLDREWEAYLNRQKLAFIEDIEPWVKAFFVCIVAIAVLNVCLSGIALLEVWGAK